MAQAADKIDAMAALAAAAAADPMRSDSEEDTDDEELEAAFEQGVEQGVDLNADPVRRMRAKRVWETRATIPSAEVDEELGKHLDKFSVDDSSLTKGLSYEWKCGQGEHIVEYKCSFGYRIGCPFKLRTITLHSGDVLIQVNRPPVCPGLPLPWLIGVCTHRSAASPRARRRRPRTASTRTILRSTVRRCSCRFISHVRLRRTLRTTP